MPERDTDTLTKAPVVVFLGPSCPRGLAATVLEAEFRPPAKKGDFYRLLPTDVALIVLIDGVFHGEPSVWHDEILAAVDEGIHVIGASSMGALRAAELHDLGVEGHGTVFEWFRDGYIDGDDEVALHHGWSENGYVAISEPLVNIRATLLAASAAGHITPEQTTELIAELRETAYPDRSYRRMMSGHAVRAWPSSTQASLAAFLESGRVNIKERDALGALERGRAIADTLSSSPRLSNRRGPRPSLFPNERMAVRMFRAREGREVRFDAVLEAAKKRGLLRPLLSLMTCRWCALRLAETKKFSFPSEEVGRIAGRIESNHDGGGGLPEFLRRNSLAASEFGAWVDDEAKFEWLIERGPAVLETAWDGERATLGARALTDADPRITAAWGFVAEWAKLEGLRCPEEKRRSLAAEATLWCAGGTPPTESVLDDLALARWVMAASPEAFGFSFGGKGAMLLELQASDRIGDVLEP